MVKLEKNMADIHRERYIKECMPMENTKKERGMRKMMVILAAIVAAVTTVSAVNVGDPAPAISLSTYNGGTFSLADQKGKVTVIFFHGCT